MDDPSPPQPHQGQKLAGHRVEAEYVHLELGSQLVRRQILEGTAHGDPRVVHQPRQATLSDGVRHGFPRGGDRRCIGDIEQDRNEAIPASRPKPLGVIGPADAGKDLIAPAGEHQGAGFADAARRPGDQNRWGNVHGGNLRLLRAIAYSICL